MILLRFGVHAVRLGGVDRRSPCWPRDEAERVPGRIGVHMVTTGQLSGTKCQDAGLSGGYIVDHDIQMDLLRLVRVGPPRRPVGRDALEGDARCRVVSAITTQSSAW